MSKHLLNLNIFLNNSILLPTPRNISYNWSYGSLLISCFMIQIASGLMLAMAYSPSILDSYPLMMNTTYFNNFTLIRYFHANLASLFFILIYLHLLRGLFYSSYLLKNTWMSGVSILIISMATAFMGYALPINQMSFWGASVITNLFSEIPYIGPDLIKLIWGGFSVNNPTMTTFFMLHYLLPFVILALIALHIYFLHQTGSNNSSGMNSSNMKLTFHPNLMLKDLLGVFFITNVMIMLCFFSYWTFMDDENFAESNILITPTHIQPEWYFLFAYAILRSMPNKLGGVLALFMSVLILYSLPLSSGYLNKMSTNLSFFNLILFSILIITLIILTWVGMLPVEEPFIFLGQIMTLMYFFFFLAHPLLKTTYINK